MIKRRSLTQPAAQRSKPLKDPSGGLTAAGRKFFAQKEGAHPRPGVQKSEQEMTPEDMKRKGSFLRRHYTTPRGPLANEKGEPTRYALQAQAWGERAPKTMNDVRRLADKGKRLLEKAKRATEKESAA